MRFGNLEINPAVNPAILDTATWNNAAAWAAVQNVGNSWLAVKNAAMDGKKALPSMAGILPGMASAAWYGETLCLPAKLSDGQHVFVVIGKDDLRILDDEPIGCITLINGDKLAAYPSKAPIIDRFCRILNPSNAPRVMGQVSRIGIGVRMTTAAWPAIFDTMSRLNFAANSIQNSVRELNLMDNLLAGDPPPKNYACGFGMIDTGYTGSSFEGLWVSGVLDALQYEKPLRYGADADHIQVKRNDIGMASAKKTLDAARYYTFYTLDMSDVLNYQALNDGSPIESQFSRIITDAAQRRDILKWHGETFRVGKRKYLLNSATIMQFATKYGEAFNALADLNSYISQMKEGRPFDLELTIDEHPAEIPAFDCITSDEEALFVLREIKRRRLPVTHIAPNFGIEKGVDYRHPSGLDGLYSRVKAQYTLAEEMGTLVDIHSADDLSQAVRKVLHKATDGKMHYKISPSLQLLFADVLQDFHPQLFQRWWDDAMTYASREARTGSAFALDCISEYKTAEKPRPSPKYKVFHDYSFAFVGKRDSSGKFLHRHEFYSLSPEFYTAYRQRLAEWLGQLATELFINN